MGYLIPSRDKSKFRIWEEVSEQEYIEISTLYLDENQKKKFMYSHESQKIEERIDRLGEYAYSSSPSEEMGRALDDYRKLNEKHER